MAEKKYLEVYKNGRLLGAFENVTDFEEQEDKITFTSDEGRFTYVLEDGIWSSDDNDIEFDDYNLSGRRALLRHADAHGIKVPDDKRRTVTTYDKFRDTKDKDQAAKYIIDKLATLDKNKPATMDELLSNESWINNQIRAYQLAEEKHILNKVKDYIHIEKIYANELKPKDIYGIKDKEYGVITNINKCVNCATVANFTFIQTTLPNTIYNENRIDDESDSKYILYFRNKEEVIRIKLN